jgi:hypothetical protein
MEMLYPQSQALRQYLLGSFFGRLEDKDANHTITPQLHRKIRKIYQLLRRDSFVRIDC